MDSSVTQPAQPFSEIDDWDNDDFVIPSLAINESDQDNWDTPGLIDQKPPPKSEIKETESIYLGPHGAPPSQTKQKELSNTSNNNNNNNTKNKVKETISDRKYKSTNQKGFRRNHGTKRNP